MTTRIQVELSKNLSLGPDAVHWEDARTGVYAGLPSCAAAVAFVTRKDDKLDDQHASSEVCATQALAFLGPTFRQGYQLWLLVADAPWQPDTRIIRHRGLWERHLISLSEKAIIQRSAAICVRSEHGIRYAGLIELRQEGFSDATRLVRPNISYLLLASRERDLSDPDSLGRLFQAAFPLRNGAADTHIDWMTLVEHTCQSGAIAVRSTGQFDDNEIAVTVYCPESLARLLLAAYRALFPGHLTM